MSAANARPGNPHGKRMLASRELERRIVKARMEGRTLAEIADAEEMGAPHVSRVLHRVLQRETALSLQDGAALRALEVARLDRYTEALKPKIDKGDARAVEVAVRVSERRCKLLGLDLGKGDTNITNVLVASPDWMAIRATLVEFATRLPDELRDDLCRRLDALPQPNGEVVETTGEEVGRA